MNQAIRLIKQDLGPNAVIVSSIKQRQRGLWGHLKHPQIEVTAVAEDDGEETFFLPQGHHSPATAVQSTKNGDGSWLNSFSAPGNNDGFKDSLRESLTLISRKIQNFRLKNILSRKVWTTPDTGALQEIIKPGPVTLSTPSMPGAATLGSKHWAGALTKSGLNNELVSLVLPSLENCDALHGQAAQGLLVEKLSSAIYCNYLNNTNNEMTSPKICVFVGTTGVGKTSCLVKMAIGLGLGGESVGLIDICSYRYGYIEQLGSYSRYTGKGVTAVRTPGELREAVGGLGDKDVILIDTAGRPGKNKGQILELKSFLESIGMPHQVVLVLSAATKEEDLLQTVREFGYLEPGQIIFTKIDETKRPATILNVVHKSGLPVSHISTGQSIPDDLLEVNALSLVKTVCGGVLENEELGLESEL